jgi:hypothetical protein
MSSTLNHHLPNGIGGSLGSATISQPVPNFSIAGPQPGLLGTIFKQAKNIRDNIFRCHGVLNQFGNAFFTHHKVDQSIVWQIGHPPKPEFGQA